VGGELKRNILWLWVGAAIGAIASYVVQFLVARSVGPAQFGLFSSALAFIGILVPIAGLGVSQWWLRVYAVEGWGALRWQSSSLGVLLFGSLLSGALLWAWSLLPSNSGQMVGLLRPLQFFLLGQVALEVVGAKFQLEARFGRMAFWQMILPVSRVAGVCLVLYVHPEATLAEFIWAFVFTGIVSVASAFISLKQMSGPDFQLSGHGFRPKVLAPQGGPKRTCRSGFLSVLLSAKPFALAALCNVIYLQSGVVFVKYFAGDALAGQYQTAFVFILASYLLPSVLFQRLLLPQYHRWACNDVPKLIKYFNHGTAIAFVVGLFLAVGFWFLGPAIIGRLLGSKYLHAADLLRLFVISIPIMYCTFSAGAVLATGGQMGKKVKFMSWVAVANLCLNMILTPLFSVEGAVVSYLLSNLMLLLLYFNGARRHVLGEGLK
jgi:O-antigen/teichoic acid export membrane protein